MIPQTQQPETFHLLKHPTLPTTTVMSEDSFYFSMFIRCGYIKLHSGSKREMDKRQIEFFKNN